MSGVEILEAGFDVPAPVVASNSSNPAVARDIAEAQAMVLMAKRYPRNTKEAITRIKTECSRVGLAEQAQYSYPRGGQKVSGPSIRLAESLARNWGNMMFGITEVERGEDYTTAVAYAWDMETNTRQQKLFHVPHERHTKTSVKKLEDPRDIYELVANYGARRMRSCILAVIPGDVVDLAEEYCKQTILNKNKGVPREDRIRKMVIAFDELGVNVSMLEKKLGHSIDATDEHQLVNLLSVYNSLKDGVGKKSDFFKAEPDGGEAVKTMNKESAANQANNSKLKLQENIRSQSLKLQQEGFREADVLNHLQIRKWADIESWDNDKLSAALRKLINVGG